MGKASRRKQPLPQAAAESVSTPVSTPASPVRRWLIAGALLLLGALVVFWLYQFHLLGRNAPVGLSAVHATFVDEQRCASCHSAEFASWKNAHHAKAMALPTADTVAGNFENARFDYNGITSRFYRKGSEYWVDTDGAGGKVGSYKVAFTFGVAPLQQYLIAMPGGRLQALGIAWDVQRKTWFHLHPKEQVTAADELHWTKPAQNANFMCAECHVTNMKRNYNPADDTFKSTWHALGVGCQACHGPASSHVTWETGDKSQPLAGFGFETPLKNAPQQTVLETCARCHSRRAPLGDGFVHGQRLADDYSLSLLTDALYEVDGHFKEEDFEYGSFAQSKMFMKGVTCVDCHNPHTGKTRLQGNALCVQCHNATAPLQRTGLDTSTLQRKDYDTPAHTHHPQGSAGSSCVACHMPGKFYMEVDFRHDHALSIPRPDLARELGTPDACTTCHKDKTPEWAAAKLQTWFGKQTRPASYGQMMHSLRNGGIGAADVLNVLVLDPSIPPIRRATALEEAGRYPSEAMVKTVIVALKDADPTVRIAAIHALGVLPPDTRRPLLVPLLADTVRGVRIEAARALVDARDQLGTDRPRWDQVIAEYRQVQASLAERPESHLNLAGLDRELGQHDAARAEINKTLALNPDFLPAITMKAEYLSAADDTAGGIDLLRAAIARHPDAGLLYHALGLAQIRAGDRPGALQSLKMAWQKMPADASFGYVYAVAQHDTGDPAGAIKTLDAVIKAHPESRDAAMTAVRYRIEANDAAGAQAIAARWLKINPGEPSLGRAPASNGG
ncbi:putative CXXCH cytochrome family protein [Silvimonas terrae]|uniref:Putative CXXCH cytochrome family protein n=1 Tax=Silvimonas terrae TaxID=300266 RepID=A0A840RBC1_9NEIS|nr:tetratricopeptide repeat protein [Silvimonas terrae]MBB5190729.1 putative CXXCH cytochrome family protein [Silvimonas terrae]